MNPIDSLGWTLVHSLWQGGVIAIGLLIALRFLRRADANTRYLAACSAMALLVLAPIATFAALRAHHGDANVSAVARPQADSQSSLPHVARPAGDTTLLPHRNLMRDIVIIWSAGVALMALWHVAGWITLASLRSGRPVNTLLPALDRICARLQIGRAVRLLESARLEVPAVVGVFKPVILVPTAILSNLSPAQVEAILAHELAHVRRHDYLINLVQAAVETVLFYHPATWWISSQVRSERENCCDDLAAEVCGNRALYAQALAALETARVPHPAIAATGGNLLDRIRRLLDLPVVRRRTSMRSLAAAMVAIACVAFPFAFARAQQPTAPTTAPATVVARSGDLRFIKVVVGQNLLVLNDKRVEWDELKKTLEAIPPEERGKTVVEIAAAAPNITVERFFNVSARLGDLVKQYQLAYLSQTGIQPTTAPADHFLPEGTEVGEYYMDGPILRPGVYSLTARKINVKQAIAAAGNVEKGVIDARITIIRRIGQDKEELVLDNVLLDDILARKREDVFLRANDIVRVAGKSDPMVQQLIDKRLELELRLARLRRDVGPQNPEVLSTQRDLDTINAELAARKIGATTQP